MYRGHIGTQKLRMRKRRIVRRKLKAHNKSASKIQKSVESLLLQKSDLCIELQETMDQAIQTLDELTPLICGENSDIAALWDETKKDLVDSFHCMAIGNKRPALVMLRGVLEGFFTSLYYREQGIALTLWAGNYDFVMAHTLLNDKHEFYKYFNRLFKDERFSRDYPGFSQKACFNEAEDVYNLLSSEVHKKRTPLFLHSDENLGSEYIKLVERVFRVGISFLERVEELPALSFPAPITFPAKSIEDQKGKKGGK